MTIDNVTNNRTAKVFLSHAIDYVLSDVWSQSIADAAEVLMQAKRRVELDTLLAVRRNRGANA